MVLNLSIVSKGGESKEAGLKSDADHEKFKQWLMGFDRNGDGRISKAELREALRSTNSCWFVWFKSQWGLHAVDANRNGFIDDFEMRSLSEYARNHWALSIA